MISSVTITPSKVADELLTILEEYQEEKDRLSIEILHWSDDLFEAVGRQANVEKIIQVAQERLGILANEILVNPFDQSPLQEPVLERSWVWEKWMHLDCRQLFRFSPLDDGEMMENPPPHLFAKEMLAWIKGLQSLVPDRQLTTKPINQEQMTLLASYPEAEKPRRSLYQKRAQIAVANQIKEELKRLQEVREKVAKEREMSLIAMEQNAQIVLQAQQEIGQQIEAMQRVHSETVAELQNQMSWQKSFFMEQIDALQGRITSSEQTNSSVIASLSGQVQILKGDLQNLIATFENKIATLSKAHATAMASLEDQLNNVKQAHQSSLSSIASLEGKYTQINQSLQMANENLRAAQLNSQAQLQEIHRLSNSNQLNQREILRLQQEVADMDDSSCIIF